MPSASVAAPVRSAAPSSDEPRAAPKPEPAREIPLTFARKLTGHSQPVGASSVVLGERWGCATFGTGAGSTVQCWNAPRVGTGKPPRAWSVPWLANRTLQAAPNRICEFARPALTFRCWDRPKQNESRGAEIDARFQWLNPNKARWGDTYERADWVTQVVLGGTFACLKAAKDDNVWCLGDDDFGQLGGSRPVPPPHADRTHPAFVQRIWPAQSLILGTWHACALAAPAGLLHGGHIACWGRGDAGQLGAPALDECVVNGAKVACAKSPIAGVKIPEPVIALYAGDLYTCTSTPGGTHCWGASRDGFFGSPAACPPELKRAWPTLHGSVPAPRAGCASTPVLVRAIRGFQQSMSVGPRGLCFAEGGPLQCLGAIRTPRAKDLRSVVVSPGEDASACALSNKGVLCWGEGYSTPGRPDTPVPILFESLSSVKEVAVVRTEQDRPYASNCLIERGCSFGPQSLPSCPANLTAAPWAELSPIAGNMLGHAVSVRGILGVGALSSTAIGCIGRGTVTPCCNRSRGPVVLGGAPPLSLEGFFCSGDESELCCNAPAYGQTVIATGRLERDEAPLPPGPGFRLSEVELCVP